MLTLTKTTASEKRSLLLEAEKNAHKKTALKLDTVTKMLSSFIEDFEANWTGECEYEEGRRYIECATWLERYAGRVQNVVLEVKEHLYNSVPDPREGMTFHQFANYPKQP